MMAATRDAGYNDGAGAVARTGPRHSVLLRRIAMPEDNVSSESKPGYPDRHGKNNSCYRHGHSLRGKWSVEYRSWVMMLNRCRNPNATDWAYYGGRGVTVCDRWLTFTPFLEDMGLKPSVNHSLDRIDANGPYCKENCRWATRLEQAQNRRCNLVYEFQGEKLCLAEIARRLGINYNTLRGRLLSGEPFETAATPGLRTSRKRKEV